MRNSYSSRNRTNSRNLRKSSKGIPLSFAIFVLLLVVLFFSIKTLHDKKEFELDALAAAKTQGQKNTTANSKDNLPPKKNILKYIVLDPGHGGFDEGASTTDGSLVEKDIVLNFCNKIKDYLLEDNIGVYLTRDSDISINGATTEKEDLHNRSDLINSYENAKLLVSIHNNSNDDPNCQGIFNYISDFSNEYTYSNEILSSNILNSIGLSTDWKVKSTNTQNIYILKHAKMPSVLVECGFLSNKSDKKLLSNSSDNDELCKAIADGIKDYLNSVE